MSESITLKSGISVSRISRKEADRKGYLTDELMNLLHLSPDADPVAYDMGENGETVYYYDATRVSEAEPETWYKPAMTEAENRETTTLDDGTVVQKLSPRQAASKGYYTVERLDQMRYDVVTAPVAYTTRGAKMILFYDKKQAVRRPQPCVRCGATPVYKHKLCRDCFMADLSVRRTEGDAYRAVAHNMDRKRVLFFDLELTGVYDHDEIISVSIMDATGEVLMDTLVKPVRKKKWNRTEKIHGITPAMVQDAPLLEELIPTIKEMFDNADILVAFGISTDYSHIKYIYETECEQEALHKKCRCAAIEFCRYRDEHFPDITRGSLVDAMATMGITWEGIPHSSIADTIGCMKVWEALFPNYYSTPAPEAVSRGMTGIPYMLEGKNKLERAHSMAATIGVYYDAEQDEDTGDGTDEPVAAVLDGAQPAEEEVPVRV